MSASEPTTGVPDLLAALQRSLDRAREDRRRKSADHEEEDRDD